ncbi:MAG: lycopene cyclase domain-containing protein [Propionicimonas sp.]
MDPYQYLLLMAACLAITLPLEFVLHARVYRRWHLALAAIVPVVLVFSVWDIVGILRNHWSYNPRFVTGVQLGVMPLEELVFFIVVPLCGLLTYEAVGYVLGRLGRAQAAAAPSINPDSPTSSASSASSPTSTSSTSSSGTTDA